MEARQTPAVIRRQDYTPFGWIIDQTELDVQLFADKAIIAVTLDIRPNRDAGNADKLLLNGEHQELVSVQVDGVLLEPSRYQLEDGMLSIS
ncbi:MAG: aminopeptidase N, partial [Candidatus Puniceispirillaceae bacterium]